MAFFQFNEEKRIGFKKLTDPDLGRGTSHQTHIGLYEHVLDFLKDKDVVKTAMLMYEDSCDIYDCLFDRIETPNGTFRSPKIRSGNSGNSIVNKIREISRQDTSADWYLAWSGLESEEMVFWLVRQGSEDFRFAEKLFPAGCKIITEESPTYASALNLFEAKINDTSLDIQKDIEVVAQTGGNHIYKPFDVTKARKAYERTGRIGEELIEEYLGREKKQGNIHDYTWKNRSRESGLPYDFLIQPTSEKDLFVDVKSTCFDFTQKIVFSHKEISFINTVNQDNKYAVYRVYDIKENDASLKICNSCLPYMSVMDERITAFRDKVEQLHSQMRDVNIAVAPDNCFARIDNPIKLHL